MKYILKHFWLICILGLPIMTAAAPLASGTKLGITQGAGSAINLPCSSGSCFGLEVAVGFVVWADIGPGTDGGIIVGKSQVSGGQETGPSATNAESGEITAAWPWFGNYGTFFTQPDGATKNIFDNTSCAKESCNGKTELKVWNIAWNGQVIPLTTSTGYECPFGYCFGVYDYTVDSALTNWSLDYRGNVPAFDRTVLFLHLTGKVLVPSVPPAALTVSGFWPATATPGSFVFVFGSHFAYGQNTKVSVNGINAPLVLVIDPTILIFALPSGDTTGPITVTTPDGSATSTTSFGIPINSVGITGFWPAQGQVGSVGFVFGGGFVPLATQVAVNGVSTAVVQVLDSGMLLYLVPPGATTGPVSVKTAAGQATSTTPFVVVP